jgi:hypothetical protein
MQLRMSQLGWMYKRILVNDPEKAEEQRGSMQSLANGGHVFGKSSMSGNCRLQ